MLHELPLERKNLHGHFSRELPPAVAIDPGDSVAFFVPDAGWGIGPPTDDKGTREHFEPRDEKLDAGHALRGPIEVRGARAGGTLAVHEQRQRYEPVGAGIVRFRTGAFTADIEFDGEGLVTRYPELAERLG